MGLLDSLPARPLARAELAKLNDADAVELVTPVTEADADPDAEADTSPGAAVEGVLVATDAWVQAVVFGGDAWEAVARVNLDDTERFDALRACESEALDVLRRRSGGEAAGEGGADAESARGDADGGPGGA